ncbi:MAG TPA: hypothetical protein DCF62_00830 [Porticoccaceae bacterium]|nr:hypothetical protein [Porticoccaceae bacterium]
MLDRLRDQEVGRESRQGGFSLVELMVGITVGLIILAGAITVLSNLSFSGLENSRSIRLNQQMRENLDLMRRELQKAGYVAAYQVGVTDWSDSADRDAVEAAIDTFGAITLGDCFDADGDTIADECRCIGYSYDLDEDGVKDDPGELFGFRQNGAVIESGTGVDCAGGGSWEAISDTAVSIQANGFYFKIDPDDSVDYEIEEGGVNEVGCGAGDVCLARRKIIVAMDAVLSSDNTVTASLRDEVKLKNDRYYTEP